MDSASRQQNSSKHARLRVALVACTIVLLGLLVVFKGLFFLFLVLLGVLVWALSYKLEWGWYLLVALALIPHWNFAFADYWWFFTEYPLLLAINAPIVDFWTVIVFLAFIWKMLRTWWVGDRLSLHMPAKYWGLLFLLSALVSLVHVPSYELGASLWFFVRFLLLFYLGYFFLGTQIVQHKTQLLTSLRILAGVSFFGAAMGAVGFVFHVWGGGVLPRAVPFSLFGDWAPFGHQHVFIAEALTTSLPIWIYLWWRERNAQTKRYLKYGAWFVALIALLTFSRAGWITLAISGVAALLLLKKELRIKELWQAHRGAFVLAGILFALFVTFMFTTYDVYTSTIARFVLAEIAFFLFVQHPLVGNGVGTFSARADELLTFHWEIGGVQDAHGLVQKLASEQGLFGLVMFTGLVFALLFGAYRAWRLQHLSTDQKMLALLAFFLILAPLTFQLFNTHIYSSKVWVPIALAVAAVRLSEQKQEKGI